MARENQGLQIALIVFVMLAIVLGVVTYVVYRQYDEAAIKAKNATEEANKKSQAAAKAESDVAELKRIIGAKNDSTETITKNFTDDLNKFGMAFPEESRFYRPLLEKMQQVINQKNAELADTKTQLKALADKYKVREASKDPQIAQFKTAAAKAEEDLASEKSKYDSERERIKQDETKLQEDLKKARQEGDAMLAEVKDKLDLALRQVNNLRQISSQQAEKLEGLTSDKVTSFHGEVVWVNQRAGTVWINLGRGDSLQRQINFSIFPAEMAGTAASGKKASIEVTQILGSHLAEARVLEDKVSDPILPGDKIYTPLWSPGEKRHFALAGFMDLDDDGKSDVDAVINLIRLNGGEVDCYIAESGKDRDKAVGQITVNTNCLILGEAPNEKGNPRQLSAFTKILKDAEQLRLQKVQFGDLLQRMGWKNMAPVVHYGRGANPNDFRAKPGDDIQRRSPGNVSDVFEKREPNPKPAPAGAGGGMYYRF